VLGDEGAPLVEGTVAGDTQAATLIGRGHETEQELDADAVQRGEAELVENDEVGTQEPVGMSLPPCRWARRPATPDAATACWP
jgi:hypothetical protein